MKKKRKSRKKDTTIYKHIETMEEYLGRGGVIKQVEAEKLKDKENGLAVKSTVKSPFIPMDLTMGEHFFAEKTRRQRKERKFTGDVSKLPLALVEFLKAKGKL